MGEQAPKRPATALLIFLFAYAAASLLHHAHNAEFLADYPNMPVWLSRTKVYLAWFAVAALGLVGYLLVGRDHQLVGLSIIAVCAGLGFDGLGHYSLAPFAEHTATMNLTIWLEAATAALLLAAVASSIAKQVRHGGS